MKNVLLDCIFNIKIVLNFDFKRYFKMPFSEYSLRLILLFKKKKNISKDIT